MRNKAPFIRKNVQEKDIYFLNIFSLQATEEGHFWAWSGYAIITSCLWWAGRVEWRCLFQNKGKGFHPVYHFIFLICAVDGSEMGVLIYCDGVIQLRWVIRNQYNIFLLMSQANEINVFLEQKHESTENMLASRVNECPDSIPYLKKGDSNSYLDQFLIKKDPEPDPADPPNHDQSKDSSFQCEKDEEYLAEEEPRFRSSSFHNFQKHLTVSLRHSIEVTHSEVPRDHEIIAGKLWKIFKNSSISTKKILHYLLGQKNEHPITQEGLKEYGFQKIYEAYDDKKLRQARNFLANEALRQIKEGKLEDYITSKKLKDKERFRKYVGIFVKELENGYLRKRLPKESVVYLQAI